MSVNHWKQIAPSSGVLEGRREELMQCLVSLFTSGLVNVSIIPLYVSFVSGFVVVRSLLGSFEDFSMILPSLFPSGLLSELTLALNFLEAG